MIISAGMSTDKGQREHNEDCALTSIVVDTLAGPDEHAAVLIVADGMGGRAKGERASRETVAAIQSRVSGWLGSVENIDADQLVRTAFRDANRNVYDLSKQASDHAGMGATCVTVLLRDGICTVAHVGDSRAYLLRGGVLHRMTSDHSVVEDEVRAGRMTQTKAERSKFRNVITKAVGIEPDVSPDVMTQSVRPGDRLLLCSDGLSGMLDSEEIARISARSESPQTIADALVDEAVRRGARDNVTAVFARISSESEGPVDETPANPAQVPRDRPVKRERLRWPARLGMVAAGIFIAAAIAWVEGPFKLPFLPQPGAIAHRQPPPKPVPVPLAPDLTTETYGKPVALIGRPVVPSMVLRSGPHAVLVVDPAAKRVLMVSGDGDVQTSVPDHAGLALRPSQLRYMAADPAGNIYISSPDKRAVVKYARDGSFLRTIAKGLLSSPAALAVLDDGSVFVIDGTTLMKIGAVAAPAAPATSSTAAPHGAAASN